MLNSKCLNSPSLRKQKTKSAKSDEYWCIAIRLPGIDRVNTEEILNPLKIIECTGEYSLVILWLLFSVYVLVSVSRNMLKRRPSKRFVLAETGEETAWDTTMDNESSGKSSSMTSPVPPPVINLETAVPSGSTSTNSSVSEDGPSSSIGSDSAGAGNVDGKLKVPDLNNLKADSLK